ncbi:MAG: N-6 DNA methylase [Candidatus Stygibacter frigidus]|nr:N-6 DNA methylase [Candidatus Stygibacter frigidus]
MDYSEVKRKIDTARNILVGKIPIPKSQIDLITITLIYKFMDDMDRQSEVYGGKASYFIGEYKKYSWRKLMSVALSGRERFDLFSEGLAKMERNPDIPQLFRFIFKDAYLPFRDERTLNMFLSVIDGFDYDHSEKLGDAFEYLLSVMGSQGDAGQFRTPRHIIDFIVQAVDPDKNDIILDPACGTAGFLISAYKYIMDSSELSARDRERLVHNVVGYDISPDMVKLSLVNMFLHRFPNPQIHEYDTLSSTDYWDDNFTVILANPPFMTPKGGIEPHRQFSIQSSRSEVLFVDYIMDHLTLDGKAGVIVPEGIIFQSQKTHKALRRKMIDDNFLWAVISLPSGCFNPYSGVKTSILLFDRRLAKKRDDILFIQISNDGYNLGAQRNQIKANDLPEALNILSECRLNNKLPDNCIIASRVIKQKIRDNEYNLSANRYVEEVVYSGKWDNYSIKNIVEIVSPPSKLKKSDFKVMGKYPVIDQSQSKIAGYFDSEEFLIKVHKPVIIFGDHTRVIKYIDYDFIQGADGIKILKPIEGVNSKFLFYTLRNIEIENLGYSRHFRILKNIKIPLPPLKIQQEIVEEIEGYEKIIEGARQVVDNYKPHIDIDPEWGNVKLGDVCEMNPGKSELKNFDKSIEVSFLPMKDVNVNSYLLTPMDIRKIEDVYSGYTYFREDDILLAKITPCFENGKVCLVRGLKNGIGFGSTEFHVFRARDNILPSFLYFFIANNNFIERYKNSMTGSAGQKRIPISILSEHIIPLPSIMVQTKIINSIEKELKFIENTKEIISHYSNKINNKIESLWTK